jgi:ectoine hydroxylase-related dioxygenase (phytanoyl-CoA dioxygenase family)
LEAIQELSEKGYYIARNIVSSEYLETVRGEIDDLSAAIGLGSGHKEYSEIWNGALLQSREKASLIYNAVKRLPSVQNFPHNGVIQFARDHLGVQIPALVDVNFRIDAPQETEFAFDWHQDYWFSVCSPMALVAWTPLVPTDAEVGGVDVIPQSDFEQRIYKTRRNSDYKSYSNSVLLDEPLPPIEVVTPQVNPGDCLFFRFHLLHRSVPNTSQNRQRWTIQSRIADFADSNFLAQDFKPGIVSKDHITYLDGPVGN